VASRKLRTFAPQPEPSEVGHVVQFGGGGGGRIDEAGLRELRLQT
jgi:hypothetical protein